ncbi:HNH endonuclease [Pseudomonas putida]|uniref:HNH endonuclease n=1 Tax=Pseudomonas putida TaxID=303 RepID=UPI0018A9B518|nr:HNH endonuclease [Pseudomonas putida]MBF8651502.1 HNH endonuclease [Pseudomonas putida]MBF8655570.1 HNH endonuclease [Pseudomonas putida]
MPLRPQRSCRAQGCRALHRNASGYCDTHAVQVKSFVRERPRESSTARGYGYKWQQARAGFLAKHPLCVKCQARGLVVVATDVDHIEPHKGDMVVFWDRSNWQALCASCHSTKTAGEDGGFGNSRQS